MTRGDAPPDPPVRAFGPRRATTLADLRSAAPWSAVLARGATPCAGNKRPLTVGRLGTLTRCPFKRERRFAVAATDVRPKITLACQECKHRNYITRKNRRNDPDRLELKKYCPNCRCHRPHRETR